MIVNEKHRALEMALMVDEGVYVYKKSLCMFEHKHTIYVVLDVHESLYMFKQEFLKLVEDELDMDIGLSIENKARIIEPFGLDKDYLTYKSTGYYNNKEYFIYAFKQ